MRYYIASVLLMYFYSINLFAQLPNSISYEAARNLRPMTWSCPDYTKYVGQLDSMKNDDWKIYANNVKDKFGLMTPPNVNKKMIVTATKIISENPFYNYDILIDLLSSWLKKSKLDNNMVIDRDNKTIVVTPLVKVAEHAAFLDFYSVWLNQSIVIRIDENKNLSVIIMGDKYETRKNYNGKQSELTERPTITDVYPFKPKSSQKNTYAKAFVGSYLYNWQFISSLIEELNKNFKRDDKSLVEMRYKYSQDSLYSKFGEPEKVIKGIGRKYDIAKEMYFFEKTQTIAFLGNSFDFNDIISCKITDDPTIIPGKSTSYGAGLFLFGIGIGGGESYRSPDKKIHNYVVNIKVDNLKTPYIRIALGDDEYLANQISSTFEYIFRHRTGKSATNTRKANTTRKKKR